MQEKWMLVRENLLFYFEKTREEIRKNIGIHMHMRTYNCAGGVSSEAVRGNNERLGLGMGDERVTLLVQNLTICNIKQIAVKAPI